MVHIPDAFAQSSKYESFITDFRANVLYISWTTYLFISLFLSFKNTLSLYVHVLRRLVKEDVVWLKNVEQRVVSYEETGGDLMVQSHFGGKCSAKDLLRLFSCSMSSLPCLCGEAHRPPEKAQPAD